MVFILRLPFLTFPQRQGKEKSFGVTLQYCAVVWVSLMNKVRNDYLSQATQILKLLLL